MNRGGRESGGFGNWDGQVSSFQPSSKKDRSKKTSKQKFTEQKPVEIEKPEIDYISENRDQIIIRFPGHNNLDQIRCEIVNGVLEVQSLLVDFFEKFPLPDFPVDLKVNFKNGICDIYLEKKGE